MARRSARGPARMHSFYRRLVGGSAIVLATAGLAAISAASISTPAASAAPAPTNSDNLGIQPGLVKHVWLIILENKSYDASFTGLNNNTYLWQSLPNQGVLLKNYYATGHSSQDNYTTLLSGQAPQPDVQDDCVDYDNDNNAATVNGVATNQGIDQSGAVYSSPGVLNWPATFAANPNYGQWTEANGPNAYLTTDGCVYPSSVQTLFNQFDAAGITWKGYAQDLGFNTNSGQPVTSNSNLSNLTLDEDACGAPYDNTSATTWPYASPEPYTGTQSNPGSANASGAYVPKHFPFPWFSSLLNNSADCNSSHIGPMFDDPLSEPAGQNTGDFYSDLQADSNDPNAYPNFVWITPDNCSDAHDAECVNNGTYTTPTAECTDPVTNAGCNEGGNLSGGWDAPDVPAAPKNGTGGLWAADQFLSHVVQEIESSTEFQDGGLIDVTFDEGYPPFTYSNSFYNDANSFPSFGPQSGGQPTDGLGARAALYTDQAGQTIDPSQTGATCASGSTILASGFCEEGTEPTGPNTPLVTDPATGEQMSPGPGDAAGLDRPDNCVAQNPSNTVTISDYNSAANTPGVCILGPQASTPPADNAGGKSRTDAGANAASGAYWIADNSIKITDEGRGVSSAAGIPSGATVGAVIDGPAGSCTPPSGSIPPSCSPSALNPSGIPVTYGSTGFDETGWFELLNSSGNPAQTTNAVSGVTLSADCDPTPANEGGPSTPCTGSIADPYYDSSTPTAGGGQTGSVLISPFIKPGSVSTVYYNHYSWLRTMEDLFGVASSSPGLDGLGHIGYAAQPGLVPFGSDVFTNAPAALGGGNATCTGVSGGNAQNLTVPAGATCTLVPGTVISGNVTDNGTLTVDSATINGNLQTQNGAALTVEGPSMWIGGNLQVQGGGPMQILGSPSSGSSYGVTIHGNLLVQQLASSTTMNLVCALQVNGSLEWQTNGSPVTIGGSNCMGNSIAGDLQVQNNTMPSGYTNPAATIENNTVGGNLQSQNNSPAALVSGNTVKGSTHTS